MGTAQHGAWQGMESIPLLMGPNPHHTAGPDRPQVLLMAGLGSGLFLPTAFHVLGMGSRNPAFPSMIQMGLSSSPICACPKQQDWTKLPCVRPGVAPEAVNPAKRWLGWLSLPQTVWPRWDSPVLHTPSQCTVQCIHWHCLYPRVTHTAATAREQP